MSSYYKVLFEEAEHRIDFLSLLLSKPIDKKTRPGASATVEQLVDYFYAAPSDAGMKEKTRELILDRLKIKYRIELSAEDLKGIDRVLDAFYKYGLNITTSPRIGSMAHAMTFADSILSKDDLGQMADCMNSNEDYAYLRKLHLENRIIPLTGNFGGDRAIKKLGEFMRRQSLTLTAFYVSNVEDYLLRDRALWKRWIGNLKSLPLTDNSVIIRWCSGDRNRRSNRLQSVRTFIDLDAQNAFWDSRDLAYTDYKQ